MKTKTILFVCAILTVTACAQVIERPETEICNFIIRAGHEENHSSKTMVHNGGTQVLWEPADEIKVFFKGAGDKFISQNTDVEPVADFSGSLEIPLGPSQSGSDILWGLYPFATDATSDGESVTTILPVQQTGRAGSFAKDTHITLARSETRNLTFYNVTGGLRFSITEDGIKSVTIQGNNNESLAGQIKVGFDNGVPVIQEVTDGKPILTLTAPDGGTFQKGQWYYFEAIPGTLSGGFKMVFHKEDKIAERITEKQISFKRGIYVSIEKADEGLLFKYPVPEAVDLGLPSGTLWASFNLGASSPEELGCSFAWGECDSKADFSLESYKWYNQDSRYTKYCTDSNYGVIDHKTMLESDDDVAHCSLGGDWRIPTYSEIRELSDYCSRTWIEENGAQGYRYVSKSNGKSIFIPSPSWGLYWTSANYWSRCDKTACLMIKNNYHPYTSASRWTQACVRPVSGALISATAINVNCSSATVKIGSPILLTATVLPDNASNKTVSYVCYDNTIASVFSDNGHEFVVTGLSLGETTIDFICEGLKVACSISVEETAYLEPNKVDLGLPSGLLWASFNLGASSPEERGVYYAWGETEPKNRYSDMTNKWYDSSLRKYVKYNSTDGLTVLESDDDAANVNLGGDWRMPTKEDFEELYSQCTWSHNTVNGIDGYKVTSKVNGNSIFLPGTGYISGSEPYFNDHRTMYWSATLSSETEAYYLLNSNVYSHSRYYGNTIRPVSSSNGILGVSLDKSDLRLYVGNKRTLTAIVSPATATDKSVVWSTSNPSVATVSSSGVVSAVGIGNCTITVTTCDGGFSATCSVEVIETPKAVDLGLGIKWAACNLGAIVPEEAGDYYAWGETEPKSDYSWTTYQWCNGSKTTLTKYNSDNSVGEIDNKTILDLGDDAANALLGGTWRLPTYDDFLLLNNRSYCDWQWTDSYNDTGVMGYIITSKISGYTDKSIFLPVTGYLAPNYKSPSYGFYWSSSLATDNSNKARSFSLWSNSHGFGSFERIRGFAIRPVTE